MLAIAIAMAVSLGASATTRTVSPGQSIASAISASVSGDIVVVNAGTYAEDINGKSGVSVKANGTVTVSGSPNLICNSCSVTGFHFDHGSVWIKGDDVLFEGNDLNGKDTTNEDYGNLFGNRITVRRNYFHGVRIPQDLGTGPNYVHNDVLQFWNNNGEVLHDIVIEENIFTDFVQGTFLANETGNVSSMSGLTIRNNVYWGTDFITDGNLLGNPSHGAFVGKADISGVSITNNLFYNCANQVSLYAMTNAIVQGNVIMNGGTAYAVGDGTPSSAFNRGVSGNVLWANSWNGYPSQGPDKYVNPLLLNTGSLLGADGQPFTADDGWRVQNATVTSYGPQMSATGTTVTDTTAPVITLNGSNPMSVVQNTTYTEPGATAMDNRDGAVVVTITGTVSTATIGAYTRTYTARDAAGNTATKTRTVNVVSSTSTNAPPTVTLSGPTSAITLASDQTTASFSVTANGSDAEGPVTYQWSGGTLVNTIACNQPVGTQTYSCTVTDSGGLTAKASLTVTVLAAGTTTTPPPPPVFDWVHVRAYDENNVFIGYAWVPGTMQATKPTTAP